MYRARRPSNCSLVSAPGAATSSRSERKILPSRCTSSCDSSWRKSPIAGFGGAVFWPHDPQYGPASGAPQFAHVVWPPATDVTALIDDRLIDEAARQSVDRPRRAEVLVLHHADEREILDRIDPEPRAGDAEPGEGTVRDRVSGGCRVHHDLEVHAPAGSRRHRLQRIGIHVVRAHHLDGARREQTHAAELSSLKEHLAEAHVVRGC